MNRMPTAMEQLIERISSKTLKDIVVAGYVTKDSNYFRFNAMLDSIFLKLENDLYIQCKSVDQYNKLALCLVEEVKCEFDLSDMEDYCVASIAEIILTNAHWAQRIDVVEVFFEDHIQAESCIVKVAGLQLENDDYIFLDPTHIFGVRIGKRDDMNRWTRDYNSKEEYRRESWYMYPAPRLAGA